MNQPKNIISSLLDQDLYKFTMGQLVFNQFPEAMVTYSFKNRGNTEFPPGFADSLRVAVDCMANLKLSQVEKEYLDSIRFIKRTFSEWFSSYRYNPREVSITQNGGDLNISIQGPWFRTIWWEVPLMALISELFFKEKTLSLDWQDRIHLKAKNMNDNGVSWIDFGTRRRASFSVHSKAVEVMKEYSGFKGTSNVLLAMLHGVTPHGTYAHELVMAMEAKYGYRESNRMAMDHWVKEYDGDLGVMLPDTLTTDFFLRGLSLRDAKLFDGPRLDSGDLIKAGEKFIDKYISLGIDPKTKILVPSDSMTDESSISFHKHFKDRVKKTISGIGTFISNDVGFDPLNMVIKMSDADFGMGPVPVIKLSDIKGKHTGNPDHISAAKMILGIN